MESISAYERFLEVLCGIIYDELVRTPSSISEDPDTNKPAGNTGSDEGR